MASVAKSSWDKTITNPFGHVVEIHRNPSPKDLRSMFRAYQVLRAELEVGTGDLLVWDSSFATHSDIARHYNTQRTFLYLKPDQMLANDINYHAEEGTDVGYGPCLGEALGVVFENANLKNAYDGKLPTVVGQDNSNDEEHVLTVEMLEQVALLCPERLSDIASMRPGSLL